MKLKVMFFLYCFVFIGWSCGPEVIDEPDPNENTETEKVITYPVISNRI